MEEVPEEQIEQAESEAPGGHSHDAVTAEDGTLAAHLVAAHGLDVPPQLSPATAEGLHDRVHGTSKAADG